MTTTESIDLVDALAAEVQQRQADAESAYLNLIRQPDGTDAKKILAVADKAGRTAQQAQDDLNILRDIRAARADLPSMAAIESELTAASEAIRLHSEENKRIEREREQAGAALYARFHAANQQRNGAQDALRHLAALERQHWALLGLPDPQEAVRRAQAAGLERALAALQ